jgi:hypothetical protein
MSGQASATRSETSRAWLATGRETYPASSRAERLALRRSSRVTLGVLSCSRSRLRPRDGGCWLIKYDFREQRAVASLGDGG